jgi:hypothetical protein
MITKEQYEQAIKQKEDAEETINLYHKYEREEFEKRMKDNPIFSDEELVYSADTLCPCGHGLAYPKDCGINHYWDCSAILKGIADVNVKHCGQYPFAFYNIHGESDYRGTTRGVFKPRIENIGESNANSKI